VGDLRVEAVVRRFLGVVAAGLALFAADALRARSDRGAKASEQDLADAREAVRSFVSLSRHLYASGGDRRFAERLPASKDLVAEILADADLQRRKLGGIEQQHLVRASFGSARAPEPGRVELDVREYWVFTRAAPAPSATPAPSTSAVLDVRYTVQREGPSWRVVAWALSGGPPGGT
jgi:hypothetical protein